MKYIHIYILYLEFTFKIDDFKTKHKKFTKYLIFMKFGDIIHTKLVFIYKIKIDFIRRDDNVYSNYRFRWFWHKYGC